MTVRQSARIAGLAILLVETVAARPHIARPSGLAALAIVVGVQLAAVLWSTDARSADRLKVIGPAALTGVTAAAGWTALALVAPEIASNDVAALVAVIGAGFIIAVRPPAGTGRRREVVLVAAATTALLIFLVLSSVLPSVGGFVTNWHPPTYTAVTRLVDPILEFAVFVVLTLALVVEFRWGRRRARAGQAVPPAARPDEMVVLPPR